MAALQGFGMTWSALRLVGPSSVYRGRASWICSLDITGPAGYDRARWIYSLDVTGQGGSTAWM